MYYWEGGQENATLLSVSPGRTLFLLQVVHSMYNVILRNTERSIVSSHVLSQALQEVALATRIVSEILFLFQSVSVLLAWLAQLSSFLLLSDGPASLHFKIKSHLVLRSK